MGRLKGEAKAAAAATAARTVPPREHGGNCDIKDLSRGARVFFPVYVPGAGLSMGDLHFSQGDGEITFCGAIEMAGWIHLKVELIKDGMAKYATRGCYALCMKSATFANMRQTNATTWNPARVEA
jgi:formamidase